MIPLQSAASKDNQDARRPVFADPILDLLRHPRRGGCFRRGKQNEVQGLIEGVANTRSKRRIHREVGLISKDVQSAPLVPGSGKRMQGRLKGGCKSAIGCVTIRDERVVSHQFLGRYTKWRAEQDKPGCELAAMQTEAAT